MSKSAFIQRDVGGPSMVLDLQQAELLELLSAAEGEPVSYGELREAGIELPASTVAGLELAGLPIGRCVLDKARGVGARLERPLGAGCVPAPTVEAAYPAENPAEDEWLRDRLMRLVGRAVGRAWAGVTALAAWAVCNGPPATRRAVRWLLRAGRTAGDWTHDAARHARSVGGRRAREGAVAIAAWFARVVPPTADRVARWFSRVAHVVRDCAISGMESARRQCRSARGVLARAAARIPPSTHAALGWLADRSHEGAEALRASTVGMGATRRASRGSPTMPSRSISSTSHRLWPARYPAARLGPWASHQTRTRWLAFSALTAVTGMVLALIVANLGANAGGTRRLETRRHDSRPVSSNAGRRSSRVRTTSTTK